MITPEENSPKPYKSLDMWRGIASIWVVMFHGSIATVDAHPEVRSTLIFYFSKHGAFGVWMFFIISGYCIAGATCLFIQRQNGIWSFIYARLRRIYPTFWFSVVLYFGFRILADAFLSHGYLKSSNPASQDVLHQSWLYYVSNVSLTQNLFHQGYLQAVYWTLCYEVAFYILVSISLLFTLRYRDEEYTFNVLHGITIVSLFSFIAFPSRLFYPFDLWPHFGLGVLIYDLVWRRRKFRVNLCTSIIILLLLIIFFLKREGTHYVDIGGSNSFLFSSCFAVLLLLLHNYDGNIINFLPCKWLSWVGIFSYSLYLTHYMVVTFVSKLTDSQVQWFSISRIVIIIVSVVFARLFFQFCENPYMGARRKMVMNRSKLQVPVN